MSTATVASHTPGPWHISKHGGYIRHRISDGVGGFPAPNIADLHCFGGPPDEMQANARLIAAAPDMLAALKRIRYFHRTNDTPNSDPWLDVDAVIAKAEAK